MESKTCLKLAHIVAFLLFASYLKPLSARNFESRLSDGLTEVIQLPVGIENTNFVEATSRVNEDVCPGKQRWPELVGASASYAKEVIEKENPNVTVVILPVFSPVTRDFRCDRVRVFVTPFFNTVVTTPTVG